MKILIVLILSGLSLAFVSYENEGAREKMTREQEKQEEKSKIKKEELPENARKILEGDAFKGWTMVAAYKTKAGEYEVEMKKGDTTQAIRFDKDGKVK